MTVRTALAKSINTVAVKLSLQAGRENVLADLEKMGIKHLKKTCSLALGDNGMTPLEHVGGYAVFASGGLEVRPYGIEEIRTIPGELLYNHDRDEPERKRLFERKVIEQLNSMLHTVVTAGTGRRSQLSYTNNVGKTGTSSA